MLIYTCTIMCICHISHYISRTIQAYLALHIQIQYFCSDTKFSQYPFISSHVHTAFSRVLTYIDQQKLTKFVWCQTLCLWQWLRHCEFLSYLRRKRVRARMCDSHVCIMCVCVCVCVFMYTHGTASFLTACGVKRYARVYVIHIYALCIYIYIYIYIYIHRTVYCVFLSCLWRERLCVHVWLYVCVCVYDWVVVSMDVALQLMRVHSTVVSVYDIHMYVCEHVPMCVCVCVCVLMYVCIYVCIHIHVCIYVCMYIYIYMYYVCIHTHTSIFMYT
jgi:hypothetical protein